ncbi:MAG: hypothetical protein ACRC2T_17010 [Thermoguttaceae bacterium]
MKQNKGPNNHLNRACARIRQACKELREWREEFPDIIKEQRNTLFRENFQSLAAYDAADIVCHLLQHAQKQISQIKKISYQE